MAEVSIRRISGINVKIPKENNVVTFDNFEKFCQISPEFEVGIRWAVDTACTQLIFFSQLYL